MSDMSTQYYYQNPGNKAKGTYLQGWTIGDRWVFALSVLSVITAWVAVEAGRFHWAWATIVTVAALLLNVHIEYARLHGEIWQLARSAFIAVFLHDILWEAEASGNRLSGYLRERRYRFSDSRRAVIPLALDFVEAVVDGEVERYGVLNELDTDFGYMYVVAEGSAYGELDLDGQQRVHAELSRAINSFYGTADRKVGVTQLRVERAADLTKMSRMFSESGDPFMFYPNGLPREIDPQGRRFDLDPDRLAWAEFRSRNLEHLTMAARKAHATRNWQILVISFRWKSVAARALLGKLDDDQINDQPLIELGRTLHEEIASIRELELQNPHVMGPIELSEFISCSLTADQAATEAFYAAKAQGLMVTDESELEMVTAEMVREHPELYTKSDIGTIATSVVVTEEMVADRPDLFDESDIGKTVDRLKTWPSKRIVVKSDHLQIDDTLFMFVRFTDTPEVEHPTRAQLVHFSTPPGQWSSFADVSVSTSGSIDTNMLMTKETAKRSVESYRTRGKMIVNPKYRRRQQMADAALQQVSISSTNQRHLPIKVLSAPAGQPKLLRKRFKAFRVAAKNQGIRVAKIRGRVRMLDAAITGILGVNRL